MLSCRFGNGEIEVVEGEVLRAAGSLIVRCLGVPRLDTFVEVLPFLLVVSEHSSLVSSNHINRGPCIGPVLQRPGPLVVVGLWLVKAPESLLRLHLSAVFVGVVGQLDSRLFILTRRRAEV